MKVPPISVYGALTKSDLSTDDARRLVEIIKRAPTEQGVAIFKSLRWSFNRALTARRFYKWDLKRRNQF
jgi:hypothetical protein